MYASGENIEVYAESLAALIVTVQNCGREVILDPQPGQSYSVSVGKGGGVHFDLDPAWGDRKGVEVNLIDPDGIRSDSCLPVSGRMLNHPTHLGSLKAGAWSYEIRFKTGRTLTGTFQVIPGETAAVHIGAP